MCCFQNGHQKSVIANVLASKICPINKKIRHHWLRGSVITIHSVIVVEKWFYDYLIGDSHAGQWEADQVEGINQVFTNATGNAGNIVITKLKKNLFRTNWFW